LQFNTSPITEKGGCYMTSAATDLWANYAVAGAVQAILLTLMVISAFRACRQGNTGKLSHVLHRDGILLYIYLFGLTIGNLIATIELPINIMVFLTPLQDILYETLTTRVILNIRQAVGNQGCRTELHTSHYDAMVFASPPVRDEHSQDLRTDTSQSRLESRRGAHVDEETHDTALTSVVLSHYEDKDEPSHAD